PLLNEAPSDLAWRFLCSIYPVETRMEGDTQLDRSNTIANLTTVAGDASGAATLFQHLTALADKWEARGALIDEAMLRRELAGTDVLRQEDQAVIELSLRDLPSSLLEIAARFGASPLKMLGLMAVAPVRLI